MANEWPQWSLHCHAITSEKLPASPLRAARTTKLASIGPTHGHMLPEQPSNQLSTIHVFFDPNFLISRRPKICFGDKKTPARESSLNPRRPHRGKKCPTSEFSPPTYRQKIGASVMTTSRGSGTTAAEATKKWNIAFPASNRESVRRATVSNFPKFLIAFQQKVVPF